MQKPIVVVGSLNMDLVVRSPRLPEPGETILGIEFNTFPGGKGANQAVAAARLGGNVRMIGRVGQDAFGERAVTNAVENGVDIAFIRKDPDAPTGVALITVDDAGQNTIVVVPGANASLTAEDISASEAAFEGAAILLVQLETPLAAVTRAIEIARKVGARVVLNPAPAQELSRTFLKSVDFLIPNETELSLLTGIGQPESAARNLRSLGVPHVIVTLGADGVLVFAKGIEEHIPSYNVPVVDTVAAGDAFVGGFAVALTEGLSPRLAAGWGNAAGALAVTRHGAQPSLPRKEEFETFLLSQR